MKSFIPVYLKSRLFSLAKKKKGVKETENPHRDIHRQNQRGIALLLAIFCVMVMSFLAVEISFDTSVEYILANKEYSRMKAYAAAKSGIDISLLRIQLYKNVTASLGDQLKGQEALIQKIWSFPFMWPPMIPENTSLAEKDQITSAVGESLMDAKYVTTITSEGSKIDLNDLDSPSGALRKATREQLRQLLKNRIDQKDKWAESHRDLDIEELINNIQDWVSEGDISLNGGDKRSKYSEYNDENIPPKRPFQTLEEVKMVTGMTEDIYQFLLPNITVYGIKGINVNEAGGEILKSIDPIITDEILNLIMERRNDPEKGGPFRDEKDFAGFIGATPETFNPSQIPLYFGNEYNFRIKSIGEYGGVTREIIAIVYDLDAAKDNLKSILDKEYKDDPSMKDPPIVDPRKNPQNPNNPNDPNQSNDDKTEGSNKKKTSNEKPKIVYWWEN